jgi:hypothetical protein
MFNFRDCKDRIVFLCVKKATRQLTDGLTITGFITLP